MHASMPGDTLTTQPALPIARYRFSARAIDAVQLPHYAGSLLRGQFGAALRHLACMTRQPTCSDCPLRSTCPYTSIFEAPAPAQHQLQRFNAIPNAYVVEPPPPCVAPEGTEGTEGAAYNPPHNPPHNAPRSLQPGQAFSFHMVLIGNAVAQLPLVIVAWQRALARGLGKQRSRLVLEHVCWQDASDQLHPIWSAQQPHIQPHAASLSLPPPPTSCHTLQLHIHTPLRLQQQGHALPPSKLTARTLVSAVARRIALALEFHAQQDQWGGQVPAVIALAEQLHDQRHLHWFDWTRYSSRQQQEMALGGVLGHWQLQGPPETLRQLWPWLHLGQWLHVGKNATMGLGGYRLLAA